MHIFPTSKTRIFPPELLEKESSKTSAVRRYFRDSTENLGVVENPAWQVCFNANSCISCDTYPGVKCAGRASILATQTYPPPPIQGTTLQDNIEAV